MRYNDIKDYKLKQTVTEAINYHVENRVPFNECIFRMGSRAFFEFFEQLRSLNESKQIVLTQEEKQLLETDLGKFVKINGKAVPLDLPLMEAEDHPPLNKPHRGGAKKFYVYVRTPKGKIKKVSFGAQGMSAKINNPERRKSFAARHQCSKAKDRTKASYWSCNLPRYAKALGLSGGGNFYW